MAALIRLKDVLRGLVAAESALGTDAGSAPEFGRFHADLVEAAQTASCTPDVESGRRAILVAGVTQARGLPLRAVAVLGLGEGEFPAPQREDPFLRDAERRAMRDLLGLPLDLSTESAESEYFYETVTRAGERLSAGPVAPGGQRRRVAGVAILGRGAPLAGRSPEDADRRRRARTGGGCLLAGTDGELRGE